MSWDNRSFAGNGAIDIVDYTDDLTTLYVDLNINIPSEGVNIPSFVWSVDVDGNYVAGGSQSLVFSFGPYYYGLARVTIPITGKVITWHFPGGSSLGEAQDFSADLLVAQTPIVFIKVATQWQAAIPYVKTYNLVGGAEVPVWKKAMPMVKASNGWAGTSG